MSEIDDPFSPPPDATVIRPRPGAGRPGTGAGVPPRVPRPGMPQERRPERPVERAPSLEPQASVTAPGLNPLLQAAAPVLLLGGRFRSMLAAPDVGGLRRLALDEIRRFEERARESGISNDVVLAARYVLCAGLDEAVLSTPWGGQSEWSQQSLLVALHREAWGGEKFFEMLDRVGRDPARHLDLMELQYLSVAFGFAGKYQVNERGRAQLADVQRAVYRKIRDQRGAPPSELSLRWEGVTDRRNPLIRYVPWWVVAAAACALVLMAYVWYYGALGRLAEPVEGALAAIAVERPAAPTRVPTGPTRLKQLLAGASQLAVIEEGDGTRVRLEAPGLFSSGSARIDPAVERLLDPVARALNQVPGRVRIEGHTDDQALSASLGFGNNVHLSRARAQSVLDSLAKRGVDPRRMEVTAFGSSRPLYEPASSPENRRRNRRVEIVHVP